MTGTPTTDLLALSVRQPWAHAIIHLGKPVENRTRRFAHRGTTLIHTSAGMTVEEYAEAVEFIDSIRARLGTGRRTPPMSRLERGGIIGAVDIVDCVDDHPSGWFVGPHGLVLANPRPIPFIPCKGTVAPLFWRPPPEALQQARAALSLPA